MRAGLIALAVLLAGRVPVERAYGVGTTFTVQIPKRIEGDVFS